MRLAISNALSKFFHPSTIASSVDSCSNNFRSFDHPFEANLKSVASHHLTLHQGEVFRFPSACRELYVLSGVAWITVAGEDIILAPNETASLASNNDFAIISALGNIPLILEAF